MSELMQIRIDGQAPHGVAVRDADTGKIIPCTKIELSIDARGNSVCVLTLDLFEAQFNLLFPKPELVFAT